MSMHYKPDPEHRRKLRRPRLAVTSVGEPHWSPPRRLKASPCGHVIGLGMCFGSRQVALSWASAWCR